MDPDGDHELVRRRVRHGHKRPGRRRGRCYVGGRTRGRFEWSAQRIRRPTRLGEAGERFKRRRIDRGAEQGCNPLLKVTLSEIARQMA